MELVGGTFLKFFLESFWVRGNFCRNEEQLSLQLSAQRMDTWNVQQEAVCHFTQGVVNQLPPLIWEESKIGNRKFLKMFIYFETESMQKWERGKERERIPSRLHTQHRVQRGAWPHDLRITTWAEIKSQTLNWLSHPGAPRKCFESTHVVVTGYSHPQ